jgi:hypothetical protein
MMRLVHHVICKKKQRGSYVIFGGKPHAKRSLRRLIRREDNTEINLKDTGCEDVNLTEMAWNRTQHLAFVLMVMNI